MRSIIYISLLALLLCYPCVSFSQKVISDIKVNICGSSESDSLVVYPFKTEIKESLYFEEYDEDSASLHLEHTMFIFNDFIYPRMEIYWKDENGERQNISYSFDGTVLSFSLPDKNCQVIIEYEYRNSILLAFGTEIGQYLLPFIYNWVSWFFVCDGIHLNKIEFQIPDTAWLFANRPVKVREPDYLVLDNSNAGFDICFYVLNKACYHHSSFKSAKVIVNLYQNTEKHLLADSFGSTSALQEKIRKKRQKLTRVSSLTFPN